MDQNMYSSKIHYEIIRLLKNDHWHNDKKCLRDKEYISCVYDLILSEPFQQMSQYVQHGDTSTMEHCLAVSYVTYKICKKFNLNYRSAARAALIHDLFLYDWHTHSDETGEYLHGFRHPRKALNNANKYYKLTPMEQDIILKHMWPLTVIPPKSIEGFVVTYADKYCGMIETKETVKSMIRKRKKVEEQGR